MTAKLSFLIGLLLAWPIAQTSAVTTLWTKTLTAEIDFRYRVGSDGTMAIVDSKSGDVRTIYWIDRSGNLLHEIQPPSPDSPHTPIYVTRDELILQGAGMALYQIVGFDTLEHTHLDQRISAYATEMPFSYPYLVLTKDAERGATEFTLLDLTSANAVTVVGDAVIGLHGKNLKVRWKSVVNTKYKVQTSIDLNAWTDYTEVMDGTGATIIVNIPFDEDSDELYARVVKL